MQENEERNQASVGTEMKIVFMGTPEFSAVVLQKLIDTGYDIAAVVTQPDRRRNRGKVTFSPVKALALKQEIEVLQPEKLSKSPEIMERLKEIAPDMIIVVSFGQILKKEVLELPDLGCFNVHASLLPKLRGASPIQRAVLDGEERTGITIMRMDEGLDTGDMISWAETDVDHKQCKELSAELAEMGAELLVKTIPEIQAGTCQFIKQDDSRSTYAKMLSKKDGKVDFDRTPEEIERQIRAFDPWPGAFCDMGEERIKFWKAECPAGETNQKNGTVLDAAGDGIDIACGGRILRVTEIQMPGKKRMLVRDFLRGHHLDKGVILS